MGSLRRELRYATDVIAMVVRDDEIIDLLDAGASRCRHDAVGVAALEAGIARIHEHRLAGR